MATNHGGLYLLNYGKIAENHPRISGKTKKKRRGCHFRQPLSDKKSDVKN